MSVFGTLEPFAHSNEECGHFAHDGRHAVQRLLIEDIGYDYDCYFIGESEVVRCKLRGASYHIILRIFVRIPYIIELYTC